MNKGYPHLKHSLGQRSLETQAKLVAKRVAETKEFIENNSGSFSQEVVALAKARGYNKTTFCAKTMLSEKTYERLWSQSMKCMPRPETVMQICLGLNLGIESGEPLFETAGYRLDGSELLLAYRVILLTCPGIAIYECSFILEGLGLPVLAKSYIRKHE